MESVFKSLTVGFLLRSLFAGIFFVCSYILVTSGIGPPNLTAPEKTDAIKALWLVLPIAFFVGMTTYVTHRSSLYPLIEYWFDCEWNKERRKHWPLISRNSVKTLLDRWDYGVQTKADDTLQPTQGKSNLPSTGLPTISKPDNGPQPNKGKRLDHLQNWADHTHFQYVSALCVTLGALLGVILAPIPASPFWLLILFALFQGALALTSDSRLRTVWDAVLASHGGTNSDGEPNLPSRPQHRRPKSGR